MKIRYSVLVLGLIFCVFLLSWTKPGYAQRKVLSSLEEDITSLVESIKPSLVTIETESYAVKGKKRRDIPSTFVGSGIIYTSDGYILTSASVVGRMRSFRVTLPDNKSLKGKLVGTDEESNLAVLKIETTDLIPAKLGNSDKIRVGAWLTVVGNSYGLPNAVALGLVNGVREDGFIQMSANVSPGNSGGPVLDTYGRVIGLVSAKLSESSYIRAMTFYSDKKGEKAIYIPPREIEIPSSGISLALPANKVKAIAEQIIKYGTVRRGYLGIYPDDLDRSFSEKYNVHAGILVSEVVEGSPAEKAGLEDGDVVITFGGTEIENVAHIRQLIKSKGADAQVELKIIREGEINKLTAVLGEAKPAYSYSWMTDFEFPEPPEAPEPSPEEFYYQQASDYLQEVQGWTNQEKESLDELRQELKKLTEEMKKMSEELERLKREKSKE
ncbi:MAG: trypsin-like peptidase domain-containing protein [candidate division Zixibacteria bacterium]|nr:trypsin-like peptidase domain-containing protein [candidate division Zixibacteria bacterium]